MSALLEVQDLSVEFGAFKAVDGVSLSVDAGEVVGIVGESGSGKSVTALALMGLIDEPGVVGATRLSFDGRDLLTMRDTDRRQMLGRDIAMIFQDPMASLNPCFTVAFQLMETLRIHEGGSNKALRARAAVAARCRDPRCRAPARRLSASAQRRHESARDGRDGDRLQIGRAHV